MWRSIALVLLLAANAALAQQKDGAQRPLKIIVFADLEEQHSRYFFDTTYRLIKKVYGQRVEFVLRHLPDFSQPESVRAAEMAVCAEEQGKLWPFVEQLVAAPEMEASAVAGAVGLEASLLNKCLGSGRARRRIESDFSDSRDLGIRGTPSALIEGRLVEGIAPFAHYSRLIDARLDVSPPPPINITAVYNEAFGLENPRKFFSFLNSYFVPESQLRLVKVSSPEGMGLVRQLGLTAFPSIIISKEVENTQSFSSLDQMLERRGPYYLVSYRSFPGSLEFVVPPSYSDDPLLGQRDAPITVMEFSDFECPSCGEFFRQVLPFIKKKYVDSGRIKIVFRNFPLSNIHPNARAAAAAGECAHKLGRFWQYHDLLFANQRKLDRQSLLDYARRVGLNLPEFAACLDSQQAAAEVDKDVAEGNRLAVGRTPTIFVDNIRLTGNDIGQLEWAIDYVERRRGKATPARAEQ